jgi:hypothetical protein
MRQHSVKPNAGPFKAADMCAVWYAACQSGEAQRVRDQSEQLERLLTDDCELDEEARSDFGRRVKALLRVGKRAQRKRFQDIHNSALLKEVAKQSAAVESDG